MLFVSDLEIYRDWHRSAETYYLLYNIQVQLAVKRKNGKDDKDEVATIDCASVAR